MATQLQQLAEQFPALSLEDIKRIRKVYYGIKHRCGTRLGYESVKCEWKTFESYLTFIVSEIEQDRDFRNYKQFATARRHDTGNYSDNNCYITSREQNVSEGVTKGFKVYDSLSGETKVFPDNSIIEIFTHNKERFKIALKTFYNYVKTGKPIKVYNGDAYMGFIKVSYL